MALRRVDYTFLSVILPHTEASYPRIQQSLKISL